MISAPDAGRPLPDDELRLVTARCFVHATRRTANLVTRVYNGYFKPVGLEATQFWTLCAIAEGTTRSSTDLARALGVEKSTLKRSLDLMAKSGLIAPVPGEGRRIVHELTELGYAKLEIALPLWRQAQSEMESQMPAERSDDIRTGLKALRRQADGLLRNATQKVAGGPSD